MRRPCRHLTEILNQDSILKEFLRKGGLDVRFYHHPKLWLEMYNFNLIFF